MHVETLSRVTHRVENLEEKKGHHMGAQTSDTS